MKQTLHRNGWLVQLSITAQVLVMLFWPALVIAGPRDGQVTAGSASMKHSGNTTWINQTSDRAIIRWDGGFDIKANEAVDIHMPSPSAVQLEQITQGNPTSILGRLVSNGRVFIINGKGIVFGPTSHVDVASLVATTLATSDVDFMNGHMTLEQQAAALASVVNKGRIRVSDGGVVFLISPNVENDGLIVANLGHIALAAGTKYKVDFDGNGLLTYQVDGSTINAATKASAENNGTLRANGGTIDLEGSVINNGGLIEARNLHHSGGVVRLEGSDPVENTGKTGSTNNYGRVHHADGTVIDSGKIDVSAADAFSSGGEVTITGRLVGLTGQVDASGGNQGRGGRVLISSTEQTVLTGTSRVDVSATGQGNAGSAVIWSDEYTRFAGTITGRAVGGSGGSVEVSGHGTLDFTGKVNVGSVLGAAGTILMDPLNINFVTGGATPVVNPTLFATNAGLTSNYDPVNIVGLVGNVTMDATNNITFTNAIVFNPGSMVGGNTFTVRAGGNIAVNAAVTGNGGRVFMSAGDPGGPAVAGATLAVNANITSGGGDITLQNTQSGGITIAAAANVNAGAGNVRLFTTGAAADGVTQAAGAGIISGASIGANTVRTVLLPNANALGGATPQVAANVTGAGNSFSFQNNGSYSTGAVVADAALPVPDGVAPPLFPATTGVTVAGAGNVNLSTGAAAQVLTVAVAPNNVVSGGGTISLTGDTITLTGVANAGAGGVVQLQPFSNALAISLAGGAAPTATMTGAANLATQVVAGTLRIGRANFLGNTYAGSMTFTGPFTAPVGNWQTVSLITSGVGGISQAAAVNVLTATNARFSAGSGGVAMSTGANPIPGTISGSATGAGAWTFTSTTGYTVGLVDGLNGVSTAGGNISLLSTAVGPTITLANTTINSGGGASSVIFSAGTNIALTVGASSVTTGSGGVTFPGTITNAASQALTVTAAGGAATFSGQVGTAANPLASLSVTAATINLNSGGGVFTNGAAGQVYTGAVVLGAGQTLTATGGGPVTFTGTINGAQALTSLSVTAATINLNSAGGVRTTGNQSYTGVVNFGASQTLTATTNPDVISFSGGSVNLGGFTVNINNAGGVAGDNVTFAATSPINGGGTLNISDAVGTTTFLASVGSPTALTSLSVSAGNITFNNPEGAAATMQTTGAITLNATANITIGANGAPLTQVIAGTTLSLTVGGVLAVGNDDTLQAASVSITAPSINLGTINTPAGGSISLTANAPGGGDIVLGVLNAPGGTVTLSATGRILNTNNPVPPPPNVTAASLSATAQNRAGIAGNSIILNTAINTLTLANSVNTGNLTLNNNAALLVTGNVTTGNGNITLNVPGTITLQGVTLSAGGAASSISFPGGSPIALTGGPVTISTGGGGVTFPSTINGAQALTVTATGGTAIFNGAVGGVTPLASLSVTATTIDLNGGSVTTTGAQTYSGATVLSVVATTLQTTAAGAILFQTAGTIDGTAAGADSLTLITAGGPANITVNGAIGGGTRLNALTMTSSGSITVGAVTTQGDISFNAQSAITLNGTTNATAAHISLRANQSGAGAAGFSQTAGIITTTSADVSIATPAVRIRVNTPGGGSGNASLSPVANAINAPNGGVTLQVDNAGGGTGVILDNSGGANDVTANQLIIYSGGAINLQTASGSGGSLTLEAHTWTGGITLTNTGAVLLSNVDASGPVPAADSILVDPGAGAAAGVTLTALSPITVAANILAPGGIVLNARETPSDAVANDDFINVNPGVTIQSTGGNVTLNAGDNILVSAGAQIIAAGTVTLNGGVGEFDADAGTVTILGTITSGSGPVVTNIGDIVLGTFTGNGGSFTSLNGSILNGQCGSINITGSGTWVFTAPNGTLGTPTCPLGFNLANDAGVIANVGGARDRVSVSTFGSVGAPERVFTQWVPPGLILFNHHVDGGGNIETFFEKTSDLNIRLIANPGAYTWEMLSLDRAGVYDWPDLWWWGTSLKAR